MAFIIDIRAGRAAECSAIYLDIKENRQSFSN